MKKKTALTKMHIAPSTVCYDAVAARDSNEVGLILAAVRKRNGYSLVQVVSVVIQSMPLRQSAERLATPGPTNSITLFFT